MERGKRYVLTGAPSCGKTTMIGELSKLGYSVVPESAREILERGEPTSFMDFQREIISTQLSRERNLSLEEKVFLDRGIPDTLAYSKHAFGHFHPEFFESYQVNRYDKIFVLDRLPLVDDGVRLEKNELEADLIHEEIKFTYNLLGYQVESVPVLPTIEDRVKYILERA